MKKKIDKNDMKEKYYCHQCKSYHFYDSEIGKKHLHFDPKQVQKEIAKSRGQNIDKEKATQRIKNLSNKFRKENPNFRRKDMDDKNNDQEIDPVHDTVDLEDLQADLETKLGVGELFEDEGKYYYKPSSDKILYAVDFDTSDIIKQEDFTTNDEDSDSDDPRETRTDSVEGSCPLKKKQNKTKSATKMKKIEKTEDAYDETEDEMEDETEEKTRDTVKDVKEDMKKEVEKPQVPPELKAEDLNSLIEDLVNKKINEITRDFQAREADFRDKKHAELCDLLQQEPYGYTKEDLEGKSLEDLEGDKKMIERSKLYKDYMKTKEPETIAREDIDKSLFSETEDFHSIGSDPWGACRDFMKEGAK